MRRWPRETSRFADSSRQCENTFMKKLSITAVTILAAGTLLVGNAMAQTPASSPSQAPAAQAPASQTPAAKAPAAAGTTHHATAAKSATPLVLKTDKDKASYAPVSYTHLDVYKRQRQLRRERWCVIWKK